MVLGQRCVYLNEVEWAEWIQRWVFNYLSYLLVAEHQPVHSGSLQAIDRGAEVITNTRSVYFSAEMVI